MVRVSGILSDGPALLFEMPPTPPAVILLVRRRRAAARAYRARARDRRQAARERADVLQARLPLVPMPRTVADCRGPGVCPVLRCRYNLALWVGESGSIKVGRAHQKGRTLNRRRKTTDARLESMADLVVELADALPSLCVLDYAEAAHRIENHAQLAAILGCSKQRVRTLVMEALEEFAHARDIEEKRASRLAMAAKRSPLVTIRPRLGAPAMRPGPRELDRVGQGASGAPGGTGPTSGHQMAHLVPTAVKTQPLTHWQG